MPLSGHVYRGHHIQNDWMNRAMNLHQILCETWTFLHGKYSADSEGCSCGQPVTGGFIMTMNPHIHHVLWRVFLWNIKSPRWLSPPIAQLWHTAISGFSQNWNHLWNARDFRPSMRFRKIWQSSWWWLGEMCEISRCLLWRQVGHPCPMYNVVSCIFFKKMSLFFILHGWIPSGQTSYIRISITQKYYLKLIHGFGKSDYLGKDYLLTS